MKRLILLRGNSGSGKTTVAKLLQQKLGRTTMLLSQDTLRREILRVRENSTHPTAELMCEIARFGWSHGFETVIVEGIWSKKKNGLALKELVKEAEESYVYYFDIPFEETVRRHATKPNKEDFGEQEMKEWWKDKDYLGVEDEVLLDDRYSQQMIVEKILKKLV